MIDKEIVVFFFPWQEVSGGPFYLANLADTLADDDRYEVWYTDYEPGLTKELIRNKKVKKLVYSEPFIFPIEKPVTLITPIYSASHVPKLPRESKILFLNWHNYCIQSLIDIWRISDKDLQRFLSLVHGTNSVFFMDRAHWQAQNEWVKPQGAYQFMEQYVPITIDLKKRRCKTGLVQKSEINIAVLGRLCHDKVWSVLNLIDQLEEFSDPRPKNLYIIGDGEDAHLVANRQVKNNINVRMMGTVTSDALLDLLAEKTDVLFAMGRSVLEGAALRLPSVIMPHNVVPFSKDAYVYLQESNGYSLGWYDTQVEEMDVPAKPLTEILSDIYIRDMKMTLGQSAYDYVTDNHTANVDFLKDALSKTTLTYRQFRRLSKRQGWIKLFGIPFARYGTTMDESVKNISVLGCCKLCQVIITPVDKQFYLFGKRRWGVMPVKENGKYRLYVKLPFLKY